MNLLRVLAATLVATIILAALVGTSAAGRLSTSSQTFKAGFGRVIYSGGFGASECPLTLEGSFHSRSIVKTTGSLIGLITRGIFGSCTRGSATILTATLPWHVRYQSFTGTLPNIGTLITDVAGFSFQIREPVGITCLASGGFPRLTYNREAGGALTTAVITGASPTSCGVELTLSGTSNSLTVLGAATRITVTLI